MSGSTSGLLQLKQPDPTAPNGLLGPLAIKQPDQDQPDEGSALGQLYNTVTDYMKRQAQASAEGLAREQQRSADMGLWTGGEVWEGGHPTAKGLLDAAKQYAGGLLFGTTAPEGSGITAYHGSPYSFDQFSTSNIGTGEGAQAYGHGLYFAGNEGVAKTYRDELSGTDYQHTVNGVPVLDELNQLGNDPGKSLALEVLNRSPNRAAASGQINRMAAVDPAYGPAKQWMDANFDTIASDPKSTGSMYEVNIAADPDHMLGWDQTVGTHPPDVRDKLLDMGYGDTDRGADVYSHLSRGQGGEAGASQRLLDAGIPGIKYLDQGSRASGEGTHNYVVFNDNILNILRKYGIAGLGIGLGAGATQQGRQSQ